MKKFLLFAAMIGSVLASSILAEPLEAQTGKFEFGQGVLLEYRVTPFDKKAFRQTGGRIGPVFGVDGGGAPSTKLEKLVFIRGTTRTPLEVSSMYEPALGGMDKGRFSVRVLNERSAILTGSFSDAAGSYVARWLIVDGVGVRTLLSDDPDTISRLIKP